MTAHRGLLIYVLFVFALAGVPTAAAADSAPVTRTQIKCPGGFQVVGDVDRSQPVWRVFFQGEKSIALEQADVGVAWF